MKWPERQRAMLLEMGIRLWPAEASPPGPEATIAPALAVEVAVAAPDVETASAERVAESRPAPVRASPPPPPPMRVQAPESAAPAPSVAPVAAAAALAAPRTQAPDLRPLPYTGQRPSGIEAMSFGALAEAASTCTACRLCESRRHVVFGAGHPEAHWMIVGDAPGELEDELGEPFVSKPGQLLDNMLMACGLSRTRSTGAVPAAPDKQVFITNALKCRAKGNSNPTPEELSRCEPYLMRQIDLVRPRVIVAMGRYAVQSLLQSTEPLGKLRGRVHHVHGRPDVPVVVTYHPAFLLRNGEDKARAWDDLCLAKEIASR